MFWTRYGSVIGWLFAAGAVIGALFFLVLFGWLVPPDRGEESVVVAMPFVGGFFGVISALAASLTYGMGLSFWTRRAGRSIESRGWVGAIAAGIGVAAFWIIFGLALSGAVGLVVWGPIAAACALIAAAIAGPLTARAARRADRAGRAESKPLEGARSDERSSIQRP